MAPSNKPGSPGSPRRTKLGADQGFRSDREVRHLAFAVLKATFEHGWVKVRDLDLSVGELVGLADYDKTLHLPHHTDNERRYTASVRRIAKAELEHLLEVKTAIRAFPVLSDWPWETLQMLVSSLKEDFSWMCDAIHLMWHLNQMQQVSMHPGMRRKAAADSSPNDFASVPGSREGGGDDLALHDGAATYSGTSSIGVASQWGFGKDEEGRLDVETIDRANKKRLHARRQMREDAEAAVIKFLELEKNKGVPLISKDSGNIGDLLDSDDSDSAIWTDNEEEPNNAHEGLFAAAKRAHEKGQSVSAAMSATHTHTRSGHGASGSRGATGTVAHVPSMRDGDVGSLLTTFKPYRRMPKKDERSLRSLNKLQIEAFGNEDSHQARKWQHERTMHHTPQQKAKLRNIPKLWMMRSEDVDETTKRWTPVAAPPDTTMDVMLAPRYWKDPATGVFRLIPVHSGTHPGAASPTASRGANTAGSQGGGSVSSPGSRSKSRGQTASSVAGSTAAAARASSKSPAPRPKSGSRGSVPSSRDGTSSAAASELTTGL